MPNTTDLISLVLAQTGSPPAMNDLQRTGLTTAPATGTATTGTAPATGQPTGGATTGSGGGGLGGLGIMFPVFLVVGMMILMTTLTGRKEKKKRAALMSALGKGDKVLTIGGQIGIVDQVRDNEVVIRTDENSNAKARFTKAAIQQILESAGKGSSESDSVNGTIEVKTKGEKVLAAR